MTFARSEEKRAAWAEFHAYLGEMKVGQKVVIATSGVSYELELKSVHKLNGLEFGPISESEERIVE